MSDNPNEPLPPTGLKVRTGPPWFLKPEFIMALATLLSAIFSGIKSREAANDAERAVQHSQGNAEKIDQLDTKVERGNRVLYTTFGAPK